MMKLIYFPLLLILFSCNPKKEENPATEAPNTGHEMKEAGPETKNSQTDAYSDIVSEEDLQKFRTINADLSQRLVGSYLEIKEALVKTDGREARSAAEKIYFQLENQNGEGALLLTEEIEHIASTESVQHQREHFNTLSKYVYALVKSSDSHSSTLYRQYCPMAFENTGAFWLSSSKAIMNPYFGDKMLKCGSVKETIN